MYIHFTYEINYTIFLTQKKNYSIPYHNFPLEESAQPCHTEVQFPLHPGDLASKISLFQILISFLLGKGSTQHIIPGNNILSNFYSKSTH